MKQTCEVARYNSDEKTMITIGDVCPLFFDVLKYEHANKGSFRQCFDVSDGIIIQLFSNDGSIPSAVLNDKINITSSTIELNAYQVNDGITMYYTTLYPTEGIYSVSVNDKESEVFEVCEKSNGALIEYTHKDNNSVFDNIFWNGKLADVVEDGGIAQVGAMNALALALWQCRDTCTISQYTVFVDNLFADNP